MRVNVFAQLWETTYVVPLFTSERNEIIYFQIKLYFSPVNLFYSLPFLLRLDGTVFVVSIISSHVMTESWIILPTYLPYLQQYLPEFQI